MNEFESYFIEGNGLVDTINKVGSGTVLDKRNTQVRLDGIIRTYTPVDPTGMSLDDMLNVTKGIVETVHGPKVFSEFPNYAKGEIETLLKADKKNPSRPFALEGMLSTVEEFGKAYKVSGKIDKQVYDEVKDTLAVYELIAKGKVDDKKIDKIGEKISQPMIKQLGLTDPTAIKEYVSFVQKIMKDYKGTDGVRNIVLGEYNEEASAVLEKHSKAIVDYVTDISVKALTATAGDNYTKFNKLTDAIKGINGYAEAYKQKN